MASEITEEDERDTPFAVKDKEAERTRIRQLIAHQKSLYFSSLSSSFSSSAVSTSSSNASPRKSSSLLGLMKEGSTSLRRLFDMEHTSLGTYLKDYSASPIIRHIPLWGSDTDDDVHDDPWAGMAQARTDAYEQDGYVHGSRSRMKWRREKLVRTSSYKRLPRSSFWRCGRFRFRFKFVRKLRIMIGGRKF